MPQAFTQRTVLALKAGFLGIVALIAVLVITWRIAIATQPSIGSPVAQVVPFSHAHHAGDIGLDCRFCHASVETGAFAGMPSTAVCAGCHAYIVAGEPMAGPSDRRIAVDST